jgi:nicotinamidase-related amidase
MSVWERMGVEVPFMVRLFGGLPEWKYDKHKTALMIVDMQHYCAYPGHGIWALAHERGLDSELEYYYKRLDLATCNLARLLQIFREQNLHIVHVNGDVLLSTKIRENVARRAGKYPGSGLDKGIWQRNFEDDALVIEPLRPLPNELVVKKKGAGPFGHTNVDQVLRSLDVEFLIIGGVATHQCVEMTIRGASDFGYKVIMVEDGTATVSEEAQRNAVTALADWFCKVMPTDEIIEKVLR